MTDNHLTSDIWPFATNYYICKLIDDLKNIYTNYGFQKL